MTDHVSDKWYTKTVWIVVLIILFFPVGLYLMWKYTNWNKFVKWGLTIIFALFFLASINSSSSSNKTQQTTSNGSHPTSTPAPTKNPTPSPTISPQREAIIRYGTQVTSLIDQFQTQNETITYDANNIQSVGLDKFRTDAITAEATYKAIQGQLNAMTVPPEMVETHSHITTAMSLYVQGMDEVVKGIDNNDASEITVGANLYSQGTDEVNKATDAINAYLNSQ